MDDSGSLGSLCAAQEGPGANLVGSGGEVGLKVEERIGGTDKAVDA